MPFRGSKGLDGHVCEPGWGWLYGVFMAWRLLLVGVALLGLFMVDRWSGADEGSWLGIAFLVLVLAGVVSGLSLAAFAGYLAVNRVKHSTVCAFREAMSSSSPVSALLFFL